MACAFLVQAPKDAIAMSMPSLPNFCIGSVLMMSLPAGLLPNGSGDDDA